MFQAPELHTDTRRRSKASSADAALTSAAAEFEPLLQEYLATRVECYRLHWQTYAAVKAEFGGKDREYPKEPGSWPDPWHERQEILGKANGYTACRRRVNQLDRKLGAVAKKIRRHKPSGLEGLRTFALLSIYELSPLCFEDRNLHVSDEFAHEVLFKAVLAATGLSSIVSSFLADLKKEV